MINFPRKFLRNLSPILNSFSLRHMYAYAVEAEKIPNKTASEFVEWSFLLLIKFYYKFILVIILHDAIVSF